MPSLQGQLETETSELKEMIRAHFLTNDKPVSHADQITVSRMKLRVCTMYINNAVRLLKTLKTEEEITARVKDINQVNEILRDTIIFLKTYRESNTHTISLSEIMSIIDLECDIRETYMQNLTNVFIKIMERAQTMIQEDPDLSQKMKDVMMNSLSPI